MPCYNPLEAFVKPSADASQKARVSFTQYIKGAQLTPIPCGQCIGCRLERSRQWAVRLMKEFNLHDRTSFLTLTYHDDSLPKTRSKLPTLNLEHTQLFMKRLRKRFSPASLRFFLCGEYGELTQRPHYHLILFGEDFSADRKPIRSSRSGFPQWESPTLNSLWSHGTCTISDVSFESAAYVARYNLKKFTGKGSRFFYKGQQPEFVTMSRRPGIAHDYFSTYTSDLYPSDEIVPAIGRPECLPPKYFDKLLERVDPLLYKKIKDTRQNSLDPYVSSLSTDTRNKTRERVKGFANQKLLKKDYMKKIFSIFDVKAKFFQRPFIDDSTAAALRSFSIGVNQGESVLKKFPDDFALMEIGSFDTETGRLTSIDHPLNLGTARTVLDTNPAPGVLNQ